jgi:hypothetical protein
LVEEAVGRRAFVAHLTGKGVSVTENDRREKPEETEDNARGKSDEAAKHEDREMGGAEEVNQEGEGTSGGVKDNVQDEFKEAQRD